VQRPEQIAIIKHEYPVFSSITPGVIEESSGLRGGAIEESGVIEESSAKPDQGTKSHDKKLRSTRKKCIYENDIKR
jgi:hypothetical protein